MVDVQTLHTDPFRFRKASAFSQIKSLVRPDVKVLRCKKRHKLFDHPLDQRKTLFIGHVDRMMHHPVHESKRLFARVRQFAQMLICLRAQQLIQMAETGDIRDQLDIQLPAVSAELQNILCGQRRVVPPHLAQLFEQIRVLDIQLHLVDLVKSQIVRQLL